MHFPISLTKGDFFENTMKEYFTCLGDERIHRAVSDPFVRAFGLRHAARELDKVYTDCNIPPCDRQNIQESLSNGAHPEVKEGRLSRRQIAATIAIVEALTGKEIVSFSPPYAIDTASKKSNS